MSDPLPNLREHFFQHPTLSKIIGDPTYTSLALLERECKANGKSVPTTLGGGNQGHLGLVSSALAYARVSPGVPFIRPRLPVLPDLTKPNTTGQQITEAHRLHLEKMTVFNTCNQIERTIIQQINTAIDADCLADLIDEDTGLLVGTVPEIFADLYSTFGAITPETLTAAKAKLVQTVYNHARPIVNIFTAITAYSNMADAANVPETPTQLINIGLIIIARATIFSSDIRKWHDKPLLLKNWTLFKEHFKLAQRAIKKSQPLITTDSLGYHEANAVSLVDQVIDRLTAQRDAETAITTETSADRLAEQQMQQQLANMATSSHQNTTMLEQMQALTSTLSTLQTQVNNQHQPQSRSSGHRGRGRGRGNGRGAGRGGGRSDGTRPPPGYCWTHGNCSHISAECEYKNEGHIDTATGSNMQGGSTLRCHWL